MRYLYSYIRYIDFSWGELFAKSAVSPLKKVSFEDTEAYIFNDIHTYIVQMYSTSYMELPPEDKRERHYKKAL